jgi:hypothetical protein
MDRGRTNNQRADGQTGGRTGQMKMDERLTGRRADEWTRQMKTDKQSDRRVGQLFLKKYNYLFFPFSFLTFLLFFHIIQR